MQQPLFNNELRLSVDQFNKLINMQLESIGEVIIEGEITEFSISKRKGVNLVLKDKHEQAIVNVSGYAPRIEGINMIEQGMEVVVWGVPQLYSPYGKFSVSTYKVLPLGDGALAKAFEILKEKLEQEGLFDTERKRELPQLVTKIALITAKDSAAVTDFLKILQENSNCLEIDFYPVAVQGKHSVREVIAALKSAQTRDYDCIVITRGGGSLEDLSAFNDETVARAIFASKITTLVAVGHEKDTSIAELAADIRASTPSQAAYYFVANTTNLLNHTVLLADQIHNFIERQLSLVEREVYIDNLYDKISSVLGRHNAKLYNYGNDFETKILNQLNSYNYKTITAASSINEFEKYIKNSLKEILYYENLLKSLNPKNVIKRGFAIVRNSKGEIVSSTQKVSTGEEVKLELKDGEITSVIKQIT